MYRPAGSSVPAGHAPARSSLRTKKREREVRGSALKGVAGGLKGLVRQFGLLLEQLPDAPVRDAVPAGQKRTSALLEVPAAVWRLKAPSSSRWRT